MDLTFYKQSATPNRVDKSSYLTEIGTLSGVILKADTNLMRPTFILKTSPLVYNSNYLYNTFTKRYYYIRTITAMSGGRIAIDCDIDVLFTYKNEILNSSGWVVKSDGATVEDDNYRMLHNDYPFRQDFDTLGLDFSDDDQVFSSAVSPNIFLVIK
jgi:hypothetical protein